MPRHLLYSANPFIKLLIQETYRHDEHYVWCSESFDSNTQNSYSVASLIAPSSNPAEIYRELKANCTKGERHSEKIRQIRATLKALAAKWHSDNEITENDKEEIILLADSNESIYWRPLLYIIPRQIVQNRIRAVAFRDRASFGPEYVIENLKRDEFDIVELT